MNALTLGTDPVVRDAAERAGYAALLAGHSFTVNPHRISTHRVECIAWGRGWADARTDLKRAKANAR
jgi:ribosome modulation factor